MGDTEGQVTASGHLLSLPIPRPLVTLSTPACPHLCHISSSLGALFPESDLTACPHGHALAQVLRGSQGPGPAGGPPCRTSLSPQPPGRQLLYSPHFITVRWAQRHTASDWGSWALETSLALERKHLWPSLTAVVGCFFPQPPGPTAQGLTEGASGGSGGGTSAWHLQTLTHFVLNNPSQMVSPPFHR